MSIFEPIRCTTCRRELPKDEMHLWTGTVGQCQACARAATSTIAVDDPRDSAIASLREQLAAARALIPVLREVITDVEMSAPAWRDGLSAPEDPEVLALCRRHGFGAVMDSAARQWAARDDVGAKTVGACRGTVRKMLAEMRAALDAVEAAQKGTR